MKLKKTQVYSVAEIFLTDDAGLVEGRNDSLGGRGKNGLSPVARPSLIHRATLRARDSKGHARLREEGKKTQSLTLEEDGSAPP